MNRIGFILGLAVLLISNATLLTRVGANSSGGPVQTIELTEGELPMMPRGPEDSSVSLRIAWRPIDSRPASSQAGRERGITFDEEKLLSMGFRLGKPDEKDPQFRVPQRRLLYVALEVSPEAPHLPSAAAGPGQTDARPQASPAAAGFRSRLKAVDAGSSFEQLRARYPDGKRHFVVRGVIDAFAVNDPSKGAAPHWEGYVAMILPSEVQVPLPFSKNLAGEQGKEPRYSVTLHYGRNTEPWVGSIQVAAPSGH